MARVRAKGTKPEMVVRRLVHGLGYRYRLHSTKLPGKPDLVFTGRRKVILVHGCFWHGHDCRAGRNRPGSSQEYWLPKLQRNAERDARNQQALQELGWSCLVVWECQTKDVRQLEARIRRFLDGSPTEPES